MQELLKFRKQTRLLLTLEGPPVTEAAIVGGPEILCLSPHNGCKHRVRFCPKPSVMASYELAPEAYYKIYFHAAKHPHKPVNGVLLGTQNPPRSGVVKIVDSVPLLHHWTSLSPMMEIGLDLAIQHAENERLQVVGYYQACERLDEVVLAPVGERVASKVQEKFEDAIAFVVDGQKLGSAESALVPYLSLPSTSDWRPASDQQRPFTPGSRFQLQSPDSPSEAARLVNEMNQHFAFGDFDDHLEDVTIDWLRNRACLP